MKLDLGAYRIDEKSLSSFGFVRREKTWRLSRPLGFGDLDLAVVIAHGVLECRVFDQADEEYVLHQVDSAQGAFVGGVRSAIEPKFGSWMTRIAV